MKIIGSFLLMILTISAFSQSEFAPIGTEWYYSQYVSHNPPQANNVKHVSIKDSAINGKPVKVIQKIYDIPEDEQNKISRKIVIQ